MFLIHCLQLSGTKMGVKYGKSLIYGILGFLLRYIIYHKYHTTFSSRIEVSTPLNSYKRAQEGVYLYTNGMDPYTGDLFHESPLILWVLAWVMNNYPNAVPFMFIFLDVATSFILSVMTASFLKQQYFRQKSLVKSYADDSIDLQFQEEDVANFAQLVLLGYLFNPFTVANSAALTTTVFSNFLLSLFMLFLVRRNLSLCLLCLSLETLRTMYPFGLIAPVVLFFCDKSKTKALAIVAYFASICMGITWICYRMLNGWNFMDNTLGFIFFYRDLQPNIGLFWYFFTEMFDHFRTMFLITFQMNATVLYLIPLSIKLRKEPLILCTILTALIAVFRSYPSIGDVGFYLSLLPIWKRCWKFMAYNFVVFCFFLITITVMPALWHLWIYSGSANANFYFGVTLAFSTGQIFLVTDLLFAYAKRDFSLKNGQKFFIDGKEAQVILE